MARPRKSPPEYESAFASWSADGHHRVVDLGNGERLLLPLVMHGFFGWRGYSVNVEVRVDEDDQPRIHDLHVHNRGEAPPITGAMLRQLPMADLLARTVDLAVNRVSERLEIDLGNQPRDPDDPARASAVLPPPRVTKNEHIREEAQEVARLYNEAKRSGKAPILHIEEALGDFMSRRTIQRRKELAVTLGLIEGEIP